MTTFQSIDPETTAVKITRRNGESISYLLDSDIAWLFQQAGLPLYVKTNKYGHYLVTKSLTSKNVGVHRLFIEEDYDPKTHVVHHVSGDCTDSRSCNLQLVTRSEHRKLHLALRKSRQEASQ